MNKRPQPIFATRPTVTVELPLGKNSRILHPEQVILKIGNRCHDVGAFCYTLRSNKKRKHGQPREVVLDSFLKQRRSQILQLIKALSRLSTDGGRRTTTVETYAQKFKLFLDWADANGRHGCLSGGDVTRHAFIGWAENTYERYLRQEFGGQSHNRRLKFVCELLEAVTGLEDLYRGVREIKKSRNPNGGTDPLAPHDLARALALNDALYNGLCNLVLGPRPFPYELLLPASLGWAENRLWLFPATLWRLPPHRWGAAREKLRAPHWAYDYVNGRLATQEEITHRYAMWRFPSTRRKVAKRVIARARARIKAANRDARDRIRIMLGMVAHNAFLFLFFCNTGANESVAREIETHGEADGATLNQQYRSIKFRAAGKEITLTLSASFMPSLRRFMELRRYLLNDRSYPYLFFTLGTRNAKPPAQIGWGSLESLYTSVLRTVDPALPRMASRKLRASMADWYQRNHDSSVTSKVLQNSEATAQRHYAAGSATDHREELSLFLTSVSESAKRQRVVADAAADTRPLEEGGRCDSFGHPKALADHVPVKPNCCDSQGCLFCAHRVLVACEEDVRKVASAAFVMEQVILGPKHEEALRPLIAKCDEDMEKIASFGNCRTLVERVRSDVFQNGNLTPFFADKYQLFLELGVLA